MCGEPRWGPFQHVRGHSRQDTFSPQPPAARGRGFIGFNLNFFPQVFLWWCYSEVILARRVEGAGMCPVGVGCSLVPGASTQLIKALRQLLQPALSAIPFCFVEGEVLQGGRGHAGGDILVR